MSLREIKKERTRDAIAEAATRLFAEHGFDAVTVADIASAADVAPRTVHRYFPDKQEMVFHQDDAVRAEIAAALAGAPADLATRGLLRSVLHTLADRVEGRRAAAAARQRLIATSPALRSRDISKRAAIEDLVATHLAERWDLDPGSDVRPRWWAGTGVSAFVAAYEVWLAQGGRLRDHIDAAVALLPED